MTRVETPGLLESMKNDVAETRRFGARYVRAACLLMRDIFKTFTRLICFFISHSPRLQSAQSLSAVSSHNSASDLAVRFPALEGLEGEPLRQRRIGEAEPSPPWTGTIEQVPRLQAFLSKPAYCIQTESITECSLGRRQPSQSRHACYDAWHATPNEHRIVQNGR